MLDCRFSFEAFAKNVREKATKCSLKTTRFYWMLMDMCLLKCDIYHGAVAPNCFKSHTNSRCSYFCQKKVLSDVRSEIPRVRCNIVSTGQPVHTAKKVISRPIVFSLQPSYVEKANVDLQKASLFHYTRLICLHIKK